MKYGRSCCHKDVSELSRNCHEGEREREKGSYIGMSEFIEKGTANARTNTCCG